MVGTGENKRPRDDDMDGVEALKKARVADDGAGASPAMAPDAALTGEVAAAASANTAAGAGSAGAGSGLVPGSNGAGPGHAQAGAAAAPATPIALPAGPWTDVEDARLLELRRAGKSWEEMGPSFPGRSVGSLPRRFLLVHPDHADLAANGSGSGISAAAAVPSTPSTPAPSAAGAGDGGSPVISPNTPGAELLMPPPAPGTKPKRAPPRRRKRASMAGATWSEEEDRKMYELRATGMSWPEMEKRFPGRTASSLSRRYSRLEDKKRGGDGRGGGRAKEAAMLLQQQQQQEAELQAAIDFVDFPDPFADIRDIKTRRVRSIGAKISANRRPSTVTARRNRHLFLAGNASAASDAARTAAMLPPLSSTSSSSSMMMTMPSLPPQSSSSLSTLTPVPGGPPAAAGPPPAFASPLPGGRIPGMQGVSASSPGDRLSMRTATFGGALVTPGQTWTQDEDNLLVALRAQRRSWPHIASLFPNRSVSSLTRRYSRMRSDSKLSEERVAEAIAYVEAGQQSGRLPKLPDEATLAKYGWSHPNAIDGGVSTPPATLIEAVAHGTAVDMSAAAAVDGPITRQSRRGQVRRLQLEATRAEAVLRAMVPPAPAKPDRYCADCGSVMQHDLMPFHLRRCNVAAAAAYASAPWSSQFDPPNDAGSGTFYLKAAKDIDDTRAAVFGPLKASLQALQQSASPSVAAAATSAGPASAATAAAAAAGTAGAATEPKKPERTRDPAEVQAALTQELADLDAELASMPVYGPAMRYARNQALLCEVFADGRVPRPAPRSKDSASYHKLRDSLRGIVDSLERDVTSLRASVTEQCSAADRDFDEQDTAAESAKASAPAKPLEFVRSRKPSLIVL